MTTRTPPTRWELELDLTFVAVTMLALLAVPALDAAPRCDPAPQAAPVGQVRFAQIANSEFDRFTMAPTSAGQRWMREHYSRMLAYSPYFDGRLRWFPNAWVYRDLYAIYVGSPLAAQHPEWILHDAGGQALYVCWGCANGTCPQYAGDVGASAFRVQWITAARETLARGYRGLYVDDVNMTISRVCNGAGQARTPIDPRTGAAMTDAAWRRYMADFTVEIAAAFPDAEIVHNVLWFADAGVDLERQLASADVVALERGVNDAGLRAGAGRWGIESFLAYVDRVHALGRPVLFDTNAATQAAREYGLAGYFLVQAPGDTLRCDQGGTPDDWWPGYDVALGAATGARYAWQGVQRRDFERGLVLLNGPGAAAVTLELPEPHVDLSGAHRTSVTLAAAQGAVLRRP
jgi:hypothetical protein